MNRIVLTDDDQTLPSFPTADFDRIDSPDKTAAPGSTVAHCLFGPLHYEPGYAYPLIIWIHGPDDDERQLNQIMPHISLRNYVGISPRGTYRQSHGESEKRTFSWQQSPDQIVSALDRVLDCIDVARSRFNIASHRVYLAGYDAGGTMALRLAFSRPEAFAGVASFGGGFPRQHMPLRNVENARDLPVMLSFGRDSLDYGEDRLCEDLRLFHAAGLHSLNIRQYPCGDELVTQMLKDLDSWLMKLVTGQQMDTSVHGYAAKFQNLN